MKTNTISRIPLSVEALDPQIKVISLGTSTRTLWECLTHFGNGRSEIFRSEIESAKAKNLEEGFMLAIGLARLDGNKEIFEDVAVEYATTFGNSPPDWLEEHTVVQKVKLHYTIIDVGNLIESDVMETTIKMESPRFQWLDFSSTVKSDSIGIELFNEALQSRLDNESKTKLVNGDRLVKHFIEKSKLFPSGQNAAVWVFIFNYCRLNNLKELFDQAVEAFTKSGGDKPKWKDLSDPETASGAIKYEPMGLLVGDSLSTINGEFALASLKTPEGLESLKAGKPLKFDMVKTKTGSLLDTAAVVEFTHAMQKEKISVCVFNVNEIFIEMFKVMGINNVVHTMLPPGAST